MKSKTFWINHLKLIPHPEGGFYREVYRNKEIIPLSALDSRYTKDHNLATCIYFLLPADSFSAFHRLKSDEIWHFYTGHSVTVYLIFPDGHLEEKVLGPEVERGEQFQLIIPHGVWFAARVKQNDGYALVGCTVTPGFEFEDFELADRQSLTKQFPQHAALIKQLTRS